MLAHRSVAASLVVLMLCGCLDSSPARPKGPSYSEALAIYNQELALLDRLTKQAEELEAAHEEKLARIKSTALVENATKSLQQLTDLATAGDLVDEDSAAKAKEISDKAKEQLADLGGKAAAEIEALEKEHKAKMAKLKQSIDEQQAKVDRAKQVKDEAEKRRP